jgi:hypothetical protein
MRRFHRAAGSEFTNKKIQSFLINISLMMKSSTDMMRRSASVACDAIHVGYDPQAFSSPEGIVCHGRQSARPSLPEGNQ